MERLLIATACAIVAQLNNMVSTMANEQMSPEEFMRVWDGLIKSMKVAQDGFEAHKATMAAE